MRCAGLFFLLAALAPAQSERCSIEGQVLNAATGEPVRKASVALRPAESNRVGPAQSFAVVTDAGGRFTLKDLNPGKYRLWAARNGFVDGEYGERAPGRTGTVIALSPGQQLKDVAVRLTPHAVIAGRVVDEDGEPAAKAHVSVLCYRYIDGRKQLVGVGDMTDDLGEYRIFGIRPGRYYVSAGSRPGIWMDGDSSHVPTYYPGTTDVAAAAPLDLRPGAQLRGIDFALVKIPTVFVRGRVTLPPEAKRSVIIRLNPRGRPATFGIDLNADVDPRGGFEFRGVAPGAYTLVAIFSDGERLLTARQPVDVGVENVENLNLVVAPGLEVKGEIRAEGEARPDLSRVRVMLFPAEGAAFGPLPSTGVDENGAFTFAGVSPDLYNLHLYNLPDGYWMKSVRLGEEEALEAGLNLTSGGGKVSIVLAPGAGEVEGAVTDAKGQPAAGAAVVLVPDAPRRGRAQLYSNAAADQNGRFALRNIAPGDYRLFAWEDVETGAWLDAEFLKPVESEGRAITIREGGRESVELKTLPGAG